MILLKGETYLDMLSFWGDVFVKISLNTYYRDYIPFFQNLEYRDNYQL